MFGQNAPHAHVAQGISGDVATVLQPALAFPARVRLPSPPNHSQASALPACLTLIPAPSFHRPVASPQATQQGGQARQTEGGFPRALPPPTLLPQERALLKKLKGTGDGAVDIFFRQASLGTCLMLDTARVMHCLFSPGKLRVAICCRHSGAKH